MEYTDILIDIRKIVRSINLESKQIQKEFGLSIPQLLALLYLSKKGNQQSSQLALRKYLQLNSSTVTGIVSRLEKKGLLTKVVSEQDKRSAMLQLTPSGKKALENSPILLQEKLRSKLQKVSPSQYEAIKEGLHLLVHVLGVQDVEAGPILTINEPENDQ